MESMWAMFTASIVEAAARSCGPKVIVACRGGSLRTCWCRLAVEGAVKVKKEAFWAWLAKGAPNTAVRH